MTDDASIRDAACDWLAASAADDADDADWAALTRWLEADPRHRDAFAHVALLEREAAKAMREARPQAAEPSAPSRRWPSHAGRLAALAAGIIGLISGGVAWRESARPSAPTLYASGPGERLALRLGDGSRVLLDARSRVRVAAGARRIELVAGAAYLDIRHDPARPFIVALGEIEVRDVGTRFDVARGPHHLSVAVQDGEVAVVVPGDPTPFAVRAGGRVDWLDGSVGIARRIDPAQVGAWRSGRLAYDQTPLALVADDIARYSGRALTVDPRLAGVRFSGVITIGDGTRLVERLRALLPVDTVETAAGTRLVPRGGA